MILKEFICGALTNHLTTQVESDWPWGKAKLNDPQRFTCMCAKWGPCERDETLVRVWSWKRLWFWV